nr:PREDICTED: uncharacterized protein LOC109036115 [Bemisia tabaci]
MAALPSHVTVLFFGIVFLVVHSPLASAVEPREGVKVDPNLLNPQDAETENENHSLRSRGLFDLFGFGGFFSDPDEDGWNIGRVTDTGDTVVNFGDTSFQWDSNGLIIHALDAHRDILVKANKIYLGNKLVADTKKKALTPTYQITPDGARWYTNAKLLGGRKMSKAEENRFDKDWAKQTGGSKSQSARSAPMSSQPESPSSWWW